MSKRIEGAYGSVAPPIDTPTRFFVETGRIPTIHDLFRHDLPQVVRTLADFNRPAIEWLQKASLANKRR